MTPPTARPTRQWTDCLPTSSPGGEREASSGGSTGSARYSRAPRAISGSGSTAQATPTAAPAASVASRTSSLATATTSRAAAAARRRTDGRQPGQDARPLLMGAGRLQVPLLQGRFHALPQDG